MGEADLANYQKKIEDLTEAFIRQPPALDTDDQAEEEKLCKICKNLVGILSNDFRPHYFFVHNLVANMDLHTGYLEDVRARCDLIITHIRKKRLKKIINSSDVKNDIEFKVLMYFQALEYEIRLRTDVVNPNKYFEESKIVYDEINKAMKRIDRFKETDIIGLEKKVQYATKEAHDLLANAISVLGIFIAIVTVIFGAEEFTNSTITAVKGILGQSEQIGDNSTVFISILLVVMSAVIVVNLIFMFAYILSRLISRDIGMLCRYHEYNRGGADSEGNDIETAPKSCVNCKHKCRFYYRVKYRFPYILYVEAFLLGISLLLVTIWVFKAGIYDPIVACYLDPSKKFLSPKSVLSIIEILGLIAVVAALFIRLKIKELIEEGVRMEKRRNPEDIVHPEEVRAFKENHRDDISCIKITNYCKLKGFVKKIKEDKQKESFEI